MQTTEDILDESDETFTVTVSSPLGGGGPTPTLGTSSVTTTISDNDDAPRDIALSVTPNTLREDDDATEITVTATLNGGTTRTTDTKVTITLGGTAASSDYTVTTALGSITIPTGELSKSGILTLTPTNDSVVEGDETIDISGATTVGLDVSSAQITLTDHATSTQKDSAELSISSPTSNVSEGENAVFTVTLSKSVAAEVKVAWSAPLGTDAAKAADLGATSGTVTFAANSDEGATESITIAIEDDALSELAESFTVTLGSITSTLASQLSLDSSEASARRPL